MDRSLQTAPPGVSLPGGYSPAQKLRVSLLDACNFTCTFCHNEGSTPVALKNASHIPFTAVPFYVAAAISAGIKSVKLTGGEPLLYRSSGDIADLVYELRRSSASDSRLSITTNGHLLPRYAERLASGGLSHVTVSVHTLNQDTFRREISSSSSPQRQVDGIRAAVDAGLTVKANVVVLPQTLGELQILCARLQQEGVSTIRLYRTLWSPYAAHFETRVADADLLQHGIQASGLEPSDEAVDFASAFLGSQDRLIPRTIRLNGPRGVIEIDRMPQQPTVVTEEGDYALRLDSTAGLHAHLFSSPHDLSPFFETKDLDGAVDVVKRAQKELERAHR